MESVFIIIALIYSNRPILEYLDP